jgi:nucleotide-binding universal stress UspA family protein
MAAFDPNAAVGARVASPPGSPRRADWASTFRVAFCVGDDERCVRDGWSWLERHFLDPQDEVLLVRAWAPPSRAFAADVDPAYAAECDYRLATSDAPPWLPAFVRDRLAERERTHGAAHDVAVLRDEKEPVSSSAASSSSSSSSAAALISRCVARRRADACVLCSRPHHGTLARVALGSVSDAVLRECASPCLILRRGGASALGGVAVDAGEGAVPREDASNRSLDRLGSPPSRVVLCAIGGGASIKNVERTSNELPGAAAAEWFVRARGRASDELVLAHHLDARRVAEDAVRASVPFDPAPPPIGGSDEAQRAARKAAWARIIDWREAMRSTKSPPFPALGPGRTRRVEPGALFLAGGLPRDDAEAERVLTVTRELAPDAPWEALDEALLRVQERAFERFGEASCWPPRGAALAGGSGARGTLIDAAERLGAAMVVVGTRGLGGVGRAVSPSVATHLAENAPCPVLTWREGGRGEG